MKRGRTRFSTPDACYFVTTTVTGFSKIFNEPDLMQILIENINFYQHKFAAKIHGYVLMPNHFHLLLTIPESGAISKFMGQLKEFSAKKILEWCEVHQKLEFLELFTASAVAYKPKHRAQVWQEHFDDLLIDNETTFLRKLEYTHQNPLQAHWQLADTPEEYPFSSAGFYASGKPGVIPVTFCVE